MEEEKIAADAKTHFGFKAQEVEALFPKIVYTDSKGILSVNYQELIPILVEKIKEFEIRLKGLEGKKH